MTLTERTVNQLDLFADCTKSELRLIRSLTSFLQLPKGHVLMRQGDAGREFVIVGSGVVHISRETEDGTTDVAATLDRLLGDQEGLARRQTAARRLAEQVYCWEKEAPRLHELVERSLK